jgi:hypothetical protein
MLVAASAAALIPLAYFLPALAGHIVLCPDDCVLQNLPFRVLVSRLWLDGQWPLWNPYIFSGMPLLGAMQGGVLLPIHAVFLVLSPAAAMNVTMLATYAAASAGGFLYARQIGASTAGALLTGFVWQACGFFIGQIGHTNIVQTAALLPWILWAIERFAATGRGRWGVAVSAFVMLQAFAGHPQTFAYSLMLVMAYAMWLGFSLREARRRYVGALALVLAGVALAAVQLLPTGELWAHSNRPGASYEFFTSFSLPKKFLLTFVAPYVFGGGDGRLFRAPYVGPPYYGELIGYVGLLPLWLAAVAALGLRDPRTRFWSGTVVVALVLAFGRWMPFEFARIVYQIPVLNAFRVPARHLMEVELGLAVLAGVGLTALTRPTDRPRLRGLVLAVCGAGIVATVLAVTAQRVPAFRFGPSAAVTHLHAPEVLLPIVFAALSAWAAWRLVTGRRRARALAAVVVVVDLALWGYSSGWLNSPRTDDPLYREPAVVTWLRALERPGDPFRVLNIRAPLDPTVTFASASLTMTEFVLSLEPDLYMMHRVQNAAGYEGFGLGRNSRLAGDMKVWGDLTDPRRSLGEGRELDLLNVRYLIAGTSSAKSADRDPSPSDRWARAADMQGVTVYENRRSLPRAWLATEAVVQSDEATLAVIRSGAFPDGRPWDPRRTVLLDAPLPMALPGRDVEVPVIVRRYEPMRIELTASPPAPAMLVLSENFYPGWEATVDDRPAATFRVDYNLRGVLLAAGSHHVTFVYRPPSVLLGSSVSILSAITLGVWAGIRRRARGVRPPGRPDDGPARPDGDVGGVEVERSGQGAGLCPTIASVSDTSHASDVDVEATLRDIRERARAAARATAPHRVDEPAIPVTPAPPPVETRGDLSVRLRRLARPALTRVATWMSRAMLERLAAIEGSLGRSIGEVRSVAAGHEQRLHQLEEEGVRLRQRVLRLDEVREAATEHEQRLHELEDEAVRLRQRVLELDGIRSVAAGHEPRLHELEDEAARLRQKVFELDDVRSVTVGHEPRLNELEEEAVRLRQMVLQLDEAAQLADRSRRGALLRLEELEARLGGQDAEARRPTS